MEINWTRELAWMKEVNKRNKKLFELQAENKNLRKELAEYKGFTNAFSGMGHELHAENERLKATIKNLREGFAATGELLELIK
jgi:cell division protein FtsB